MLRQKIMLQSVLMVALMFMPVCAFAQQPEASSEDLLFMEIPMVSSVGFFDIDARKAPGSLYTVNAIQLDASNARTIAEVLSQYVPGIYITNHGFMGPLIGTRGITTDSSSKTTFMVDGMSTNPRWHFGAAESTRMPFLGDIDKIEMIQGPGAIVHGAGAINGFINVIPKNGEDYKGWDIRTKYGFDENLKQTEIGYGANYGKGRNVYAFVGLAKSSGVMLQKVMTSPNFVAGTEPYYRVNGTLYPAMKMAAYWRHDNFKLNTIFERNFSLPYEIFWFGLGNYHGMLAINPEYTWDLSPTDSLTTDISIILQDNHLIWLRDGNRPRSPSLIAKQGDIYIDSGNGASESYLGQKFVYRTEKVDKHKIAIGCEVGKREFYNNGFSFFWNEAGVTSRNIPDQPAHVYGWLEYSFFFEDVVSLTDKLTMSLGGREDIVDYPDPFNTYYNSVSVVTYASIKNGSTDHFSPRVAFSYEVSPVTIAKLSYQHGFRWPNAVDLLRNMSPRWDSVQGQNYTFTAPGPETMDSYEFNVHHDAKALNLGLDLNTYYNKLHGTLGWTQPGVAAAGTSLGWTGNSPSFDSIGYELAAKWQAVKSTAIDASYGFSRPLHYRDDIIGSAFFDVVPTNIDGNKWARYPTHMIKLSLTTKLFNEKLTLHENVQFRSSVQYREKAADYNQYYKWLDQTSYVVNAAVKYAFARDWYAKFSVNNIFRNRNNMPIWGMSSQNFAENYSDRRQMYLEVGCKF
jgi:outer membrane receptor protein involved in Fe transport